MSDQVTLGDRPADTREPDRVVAMAGIHGHVPERYLQSIVRVSVLRTLCLFALETVTVRARARHNVCLVRGLISRYKLASARSVRAIRGFSPISAKSASA